MKTPTSVLYSVRKRIRLLEEQIKKRREKIDELKALLTELKRRK